ncbi:rRNA-binding ribosome biosynthesis protein [Dimargaris verticillata]|uniref:rRNA-binding ribosome biosynthesis protein n=1 Tax=Dimargaris verticillata TaxID=2761393 RepID=A0A9W8EFQ5_9FUNG|nr:rRNA-binding ribosome biosynthesis protein [Dimargaris verticillata]
MPKRKRGPVVQKAKADAREIKEGEVEAPASIKTPKSFVIRTGRVGRNVMSLVQDIRRTMEPNTASKLKERKTNRFKDFVAVAGMLKVTHMLVLSRTEIGTNIRFTRMPHGPTLTCRVYSYSLAKDVIKLNKAPGSLATAYRTAPLLILNNFDYKQEHLKLMGTTLQNMFPSIQVKTMSLHKTQRVVMFNYNKETERIDFRQYIIRVKRIGVSKSIKRIMANKLPTLKGIDDISEYVLREAAASESDMEDGPDNTVTVTGGRIGSGPEDQQSDKRAIRLQEIGPRMELQLFKIEAGVCAGDVIYHRFITKTPEQLEAEAHARIRKASEAADRRREQKLNVEKKKAKAEEHRQKTREGGLAGMRKKHAMEAQSASAEDSGAGGSEDEGSEDLDGTGDDAEPQSDSSDDE